MRTSRIIGTSIATLIGISGVIAYVVLPSWQQRAAHNLNAIHKAIDEMHPAVLEPDATAFHEWHTKGYEQAKALLPLVNSPADEYALLQFYFAGYQDPHINFMGPHQYPLQRWYPNRDRWAGWVLKYSNSMYKVAYSLPQDNMPPVGAKLLRCDGQQIDTLLQSRYAPFADLRWNVPIAHDKAAELLTIDSEQMGNSMLNRPTVTQCEFLNKDDTTKTYPFHWQPLADSQLQKIQTLLRASYQLPSIREFAPNRYWIDVRDFMLQTPQAFAAHQKLLKDINALGNYGLVVLDARANGGGNAMYGLDMLKALLKDNYTLLLKDLQNRSNGADSLYRVSQYTLWSEEAQLETLRSAQGNDALMVKYLSSFIDKYQHALSAGKTTAHSSELTPNVSLFPELNSDTKLPSTWTFNGKIILVTEEHCVSSCLDFVEFVKAIPGVVHVGQTTDADTAYTTIAGMRETSFKENVFYMVPIVKHLDRRRQNNIPYTPDIAYEGDINDTAALEKRILEIAKSH